MTGLQGDASEEAERRRSVLVLCPYPLAVAAGQRLKFEQYYEDWRAAGWQVTPAPFMSLRLWQVAFQRGHVAAKLIELMRGYLRRVRDLFRLGRYELVYVFMYVTPLGPSFSERLVRALAKRLVFDVEDNVLIGQALSKRDHPNWIGRLLRGKGKAEYLIRTADHVITSSPALNEICAGINERHACTYISSSLDALRFRPANRFTNEGKVTVGWTGTFSTRPFLDLLRPVLQQLATERDFRLRVIGNFDYDLPGVDLEVIGWSSEREIEDLQKIDIGLYPLPLNDWVSGKSGLKAIQYMMMGLPCVATAVGTTPLLIRDRVNGLLVRTEDEWLKALRELIDDPALRRRLGEEARREAVAKYSTKSVAAHYRAVLDSVMEC